MAEVEFQPFPKIPRISRECIVTEKIDGTNACIYIVELDGYPGTDALYESGGLALYAGSRKRWVTPAADNFGFASWCCEHADELLMLGPGRHFGEWWGKGIQRGYGLREKRFSLFNTTRWCLHDDEPRRIVTGDPRQEKYQERLPACCGLVPVLWSGEFMTDVVAMCLGMLQNHGSRAAPGFMDPEGVVVYHVAGNLMFKKTLKNDAVPKGKAQARHHQGR